MEEQIKKAIESCGVALAPEDVSTILAAVMSAMEVGEGEPPEMENSAPAGGTFTPLDALVEKPKSQWD